MSTTAETSSPTRRQQLWSWLRHKPEKLSDFIVWGAVWVIGPAFLLIISGVITNVIIQTGFFALGFGRLKLFQLLIIGLLLLSAYLHTRRGAPKSAYWIPGLVTAILVLIMIVHGLPRAIWNLAKPESGLVYQITSGLHENPFWAFVVFLVLWVGLLWFCYKLVGQHGIAGLIKVAVFGTILLLVLFLLSLTPIIEVVLVVLSPFVIVAMAGLLPLNVIGLALMPSIFRLNADKNEIRVDENGQRVYDLGKRDEDGNVIWQYEDNRMVVLSVHRRPNWLAVGLLVLFFFVISLVTGMTLEVATNN